MTQYQFAPLLSDYLVYAMLLAAAALAVLLRRSPTNRAALLRVISRDLPAAASVVLAAFLLIGALDSVHLRERLPEPGADGVARYHPEVLSLLDLLLGDLRRRTETTYSAPFALYSFSKEIRFEASGEALWRHPRLAHAGRTLEDPAQRGSDILRRMALASGAAALLGAVLGGLTCALLARRWGVPLRSAARRIANGQTPSSGVLSLRAGTFDDTSWVRPAGHIWVKNAQEWIKFDKDDLLCDTQPTDFDAYAERFRSFRLFSN